mmetsp:Transcript_20924/g.64389  ORF Transcript_20924/g.64389 Transcript_20924/m.64389 type:complete len:288 (+) Transcript_20924:97-960(+)
MASVSVSPCVITRRKKFTSPPCAWKPTSASPRSCMRFLTSGATRPNASGSRCSRSLGGTALNKTFAKSPPPNTSSSDPSVASTTRFRTCAASSRHRWTRCAMPTSPIAFHISHNLNASGRRPHMMVRSPASRSVLALSGWKRYGASAAFVATSAPAFLGAVTKTLHESATFISLCGFTTKLSHFSMPFNHRADASASQSAEPPQLPSTWCQRPSASQIAATSSIASNAPRTVVPAVDPTKNGVLPAAFASATALVNASPRMRPSASVGTAITLSSPSPKTRQDFLNE